MQFCPRYVGVAWTHLPGNKALLTRLRCGLWSCPYCSRKNASIWRAFLLNKLPKVADDWWLLTLTAHSKLRTRGQSLENIRTNIDRLMKRLHRTFGEFDYVRTYEKHPTSEAIHAHLIVSNLAPYVVHGHYKNWQRGFVGVLARPYRLGCWSVNSYIKILTQEVGMGYIADCRPLTGDTSFAVNYVTKYLTKEQQDINEKGLRHVQTSRGIGSPKVEAKYDWQVGGFVTNRDFFPGERLTDLQTGEALLPDYWFDEDVYPDEMR
jgi:hypothetical protein